MNAQVTLIGSHGLCVGSATVSFEGGVGFKDAVNASNLELPRGGKLLVTVTSHPDRDMPPFVLDLHQAFGHGYHISNNGTEITITRD